MAVVEVIGIEIDAAGGHPGLVDAGDLAHQLSPLAVGIAQSGTDRDGGLSKNGRAVGPEADGVISGVAAAQTALCHHDADGQARAEIKEVAVDAGHHPVALGLQLFGGSADCAQGRQHRAGGHDRRDLSVGRISNQVLRPTVRVGRAPKHVGGELGLPMQQCVLGRQVLAQRLGRGGRQRQGAQQCQHDQRRQGSAEKMSHRSPPNVQVSMPQST